ncbi:diiron oxygenase [Corallococcus coralloides]|uniref:diiron oxygenase n=1 Tax=Corallococcus coralloides TaxID=184914 RepID=UPI00385115CE
MAERPSAISPRDYKTKELVWNSLAATRSKPRRVLPEGDVVGHLYPPAKAALLTHPLMKNLPPDKLRLFFIHSAYKFMEDIAIFETETVNEVAMKISNGHTPIAFPDDIRHDALTIIIDEAYHAYVARDFMRQIEQRTGVKPLPMGTETDLSRSMAFGKQRLPESLHGLWEIIAVCLGENTLTKDLLNLTAEKTFNEVLHLVMEDHVRDEGRHAVLFMNVLKLVWSEMDESARLAIGQVLPGFIREYLDPKALAGYERVVLEQLGLPAEHIERILSETYVEPALEDFRARYPLSGYLVYVLMQCDVLAHAPTREALRRFKLLPQ